MPLGDEGLCEFSLYSQPCDLPPHYKLPLRLRKKREQSHSGQDFTPQQSPAGPTETRAGQAPPQPGPQRHPP